MHLNHALSTPPDKFCLQPNRMYYPLFIKATLFINFCATVIVGTWVVLLKGCNRGSSSTCLKPFFWDIFFKTKAHWPSLTSQSETLKLKLFSPLFDNISYKTLYVHVNTAITNFLFLPMAVLLFIFLPLKRFTSKYPNQIYAKKKGIRVWPKNHILGSAPSIGRSFYQSRWSPFSFFLFRQSCLYISDSLHLFHSISDRFYVRQKASRINTTLPVLF